MALSILDGNQSATTLSTILSSGQHITAHTVVSLGTQAITDMRGAVSGSVVSISNLPITQTIAGTVTANLVGLAVGQRDSIQTDGAGSIKASLVAGGQTQICNDDGDTFNATNPLPISGAVTANGVWSDGISPSVVASGDANPVYGVGIAYASGNDAVVVSDTQGLPISGTVTIGSALPAGTNRIGVVTIGGGTVTIGAGTSQIGSVTASISGTVPISISSVTVGNSITIGSCVTHGVTIANTSVTINGSITANLTYSQTAVSLSSTAATAIPIVLPTNGIYGGTLQGYNGTNTYIYSGIQAIGNTSLASATSLPVSLGSLPALVAGTAQIGSVTASISNSVVTFYPMQGTSVSSTNFTSLTSSTSLVSAVANREVLTVFNEGAGNLHISAGATCTTISYQVRLSAGDYWECPQGQLSLAHTAVFATAGTARVTQVS